MNKISKFHYAFFASFIQFKGRGRLSDLAYKTEPGRGAKVGSDGQIGPDVLRILRSTKSLLKHPKSI